LRGLLTDKEIEAAIKEKDIVTANARFKKLMLRKFNKSHEQTSPKRVYRRPN